MNESHVTLKIKVLLVILTLITLKSYSQISIYHTGFDSISHNVILGTLDEESIDHWRASDATFQRWYLRCLVDSDNNQYMQMDSMRNAWTFSDNTFPSNGANFNSIHLNSLGISALNGLHGNIIYENIPGCDAVQIIRKGRFDYFDTIPTDRWVYRLIPTRGFAGIKLSFKWKCQGMLNEDYGQVGYSLDGGKTWKWLTTGGCTNTGMYYGCYSPISKVQTANLSFPAECNQQDSLAIGFRFKTSGNGLGKGPVFIIDYISMTGTPVSPCKNARITKQPADLTICKPSSAQFSVTATGDDEISFQWQVNNGNWTNIINGGSNPAYSGTTTAILNISNPATTLQYRCIATNCSGSGIATSDTATLIVNAAPTTNIKFTKQIKYNGDNASFSLNPEGTSPFNYQWKLNGDDIPGATNSILNLLSISCPDTGLYTCNISNVCGNITPKISEIYNLSCFGRFKFAVSGYVKYNNKDSSAMSSHSDNTITNVSLMTQGDTIIDKTETDDFGFYVIEGIVNGSYKLAGSTLKKWGGCNPIDALLINRNYIGLFSITDPLKKIASDVNNDKQIRPNDALLVNRRYIGLLKNFLISDWQFSNPAITVESGNITKDLQALCAGDVNASYSPIPQKIIYNQFNNAGSINIVPGKVFNLPVYINDFNELGAIGLKFQVSGSMFQVIDVKSDIEGLIYNIIKSDESDKSLINIAWSADNQGLNITPDKPLFYIVAKCNEQKTTSKDNDTPILFSNSESVIADINANTISLDKILIPKIILEARSTKPDAQINVYPNPFNRITNISYSLPVDANVNINVYNVLGEKISNLEDNWKKSGQYSIKFDASALKQGVYFLKLRVNESGSDNYKYTKTKILLIAK